MSISTQERLEQELCEPAEIALARRMGVSAIDIYGLREYCNREGRVLIIRSGNPASRQHFFERNARPKPLDVKGKTGRDGLVRTRSGRFFSDYDMMSLWQFDGRAHHKVWTNDDPDLLYALNNCCASRGMFMHGGNDDYYGPEGDFLGNGTVDWDQPLLAFDRHGRSFAIVGKERLRRFYNFHRMASEQPQKLTPGGDTFVPMVWPYR